MASVPQLWHVYFVAQCRHTLPDPKDKFVVIAHIDTEHWGFLVNSRISEYIASRPQLLVCEADILLKGHVWLKYDSFVDCRTLFPFTDTELQADRGLITAEAKQSILTTIQQCRVLNYGLKRKILDRELGTITPPPTN